MRYRIMGTPAGGTEMAFTVAADSPEEAKRKAEMDGIRVRDVSLITEAMAAGERWFVGATGMVLLVDAVIALFVAAGAVSAVMMALGARLMPWSVRISWQGGGAVVALVGTTLLLAQGAYAGSRLARVLDLVWACLHALLSVALVAVLVAELAAASGARGAVPVLGTVVLLVPVLRVGAYVFLVWVLWGSRSARAFLDAQATKRVQLVTVSSVALLVLVVASLLVLATIPFGG